MNKPNYYVSTCPDTGRQFLVETGKDGNIIELRPSTVGRIRRMDAREARQAKNRESMLRALEACRMALSGAASLIRVNRHRFPKSIKNSDKFQLELVNAEVEKVLYRLDNAGY